MRNRNKFSWQAWIQPGDFSRFPPLSVATAQLLRELLVGRLRGIIEQRDSKANVIGYSYGSGYKDLICTIMLSKKGVKLGFCKGGELPDPHHLLSGSGKIHRYVEIESEKVIRSYELRELLDNVVEAYRRRSAS
jgi:hypothetical protein